MTSPRDDLEGEGSPPPRDVATGDDDGVDVTLIRWTLSLSVPDRLRLLQAQANSLSRLREDRQPAPRTPEGH